MHPMRRKCVLYFLMTRVYLRLSYACIVLNVIVFKITLSCMKLVSLTLCFCLVSFPVDERGTMKSVVEYFYETYGFVIQHTQWPCLQVGNQQRPNYLPMEVSRCYNY